MFENFGGYNKNGSIMENALKYLGHWTPIATRMIVIYTKSMQDRYIGRIYEHGLIKDIL